MRLWRRISILAYDLVDIAVRASKVIPAVRHPLVPVRQSELSKVRSFACNCQAHHLFIEFHHLTEIRRTNTNSDDVLDLQSLHQQSHLL